MARHTGIGMSQRMRIEWLEKTAQLALAGEGRSSAEKALQEALCDKVSIGGHAIRGNREKVVTILVRTWVDVESSLERMRDAGLELIRELPMEQHVAVHWAMVSAAYPFWSHVAEIVGRLLQLQGTASATAVQRRVRERFGERDTVSRAARRVIRSLIDWGVTRDSTPKGLYERAGILRLSAPEVIAFLVEGILRAGSEATVDVRSATNHPALFPFAFDSTAILSLRDHPRLEVLRQSLDEDVVVLR